MSQSPVLKLLAGLIQALPEDERNAMEERLAKTLKPALETAKDKAELFKANFHLGKALYETAIIDMLDDKEEAFEEMDIEMQAYWVSLALRIGFNPETVTPDPFGKFNNEPCQCPNCQAKAEAESEMDPEVAEIYAHAKPVSADELPEEVLDMLRKRGIDPNDPRLKISIADSDDLPDELKARMARKH